MRFSLHYLLLITQNSFQKKVLAKVNTIGLLPGQPKVLDFLNEQDGREQKDIAKGCCLEPATVTGILGRMETVGLIERKQIDGNRRSLYVFLTEKGKESAAKTDEIFLDVESKALKGITKEQQEEFVLTLQKIYENLSEDTN